MSAKYIHARAAGGTLAVSGLYTIRTTANQGASTFQTRERVMTNLIVVSAIVNV